MPPFRWTLRMSATSSCTTFYTTHQLFCTQNYLSLPPPPAVTAVWTYVITRERSSPIIEYIKQHL